MRPENEIGEYQDALTQAPVSEAAPQTESIVDLYGSQNEKQRQVLETLQAGVEGILTSEGYQAYLQTMAKFHRYSFNNSLLIHVQNPDATHVAGYNRWKDLGRQVRKGEKAMKIFVPYRRKVEDPDTGEEDYRVTGFGIGNVFDIASTDGEPLPEPPRVIESTEVNDVSREVNKRLSRFGIDSGLLMESKDFPGGAHGFWHPYKRQIVIRSAAYFDEESGEERYLVDPLNVTKTKTLTHEMAHFVADHKGADDRHDAEVVAEGSAYVALKHFGLDTDNYSFGYVAGWAGDAKRLRANLGETQRIANILISAIEGTEPEDEPDLT